MSAPIMQSLWIGDALSNLERLCVQSFLANGHAFHLYAYADIDGVPAGATLKDAGDILPASAIYRHRRGSLALFADWFRWELLHRHGDWWVDMDVVCLKRFDFADAVVFGIGGGYCMNHTMKFPAHHAFCAHMAMRCAKPNRIFAEDSLRVCTRKIKRRLQGRGKAHIAWGESGGPAGFTAAAKRFDLLRAGQPTEVFAPEYADRGCAGAWHEILLRPSDRDPCAQFPASYSLHIGNENLRRAGFDKNAAYPPGSPLDRLQSKYGV